MAESSAIELTPTEARILGVLIEKAITTPDQYPLTLNALTSGANQKSNRFPVLSLEEDEVMAAIDDLRQKGLVFFVHTSTGRTQRFQQEAREVFELSRAELAVFAELLLRGPQTQGELRGRSSRMHKIESLEELAAILNGLKEKNIAQQIAPASGSRAPRFVQTLTQEDWPEADSSKPAMSSSSSAQSAPGLEQRVATLEHRVRTLEEQIKRLQFGAAAPPD